MGKLADEVPDLAQLYELHEQNQMGKAQRSEDMSEDQVFWMEGILFAANLTATTGAGNPKKIIELKANAEDEFSKNINFWGDDLAKVPDNLMQYRGYRLQVGYTNFLPTGRKHPMKVGVALVLCNEKGELPPLPPNPETQEAPAPTQAPFTPQMDTYIPPTTTGTGPPPLTTAVPPVKEPVVHQDESTRVESMVRQACFKGGYSALHGAGLSDTQIRNKLEYWTDWAMLNIQRMTTTQHRQMEAKISGVIKPESREMFKQFLVEEANCTEMGDSGSLHLTDMSEAHADRVMGEWWDNMISVWPLWKQENEKKKKSDKAPSPQSQGPVLTGPVKPVDDDRPDFMKQ